MKPKILLSGVSLVFALVLSGLGWAQCPEAPNDLGECDTLHVVPWSEMDTCFADHYFSGGQWHYDTICINDPGELFPAFLCLNLFVTHDSNTFWWEAAGKWVQDSIQAFVVPLGWTHTNQTAYCSLSGYWNQNVVGWWDPNYGRSMWRHIPKLGSDSLNRIEWLAENGQTWSTMMVDMSSDSVWYSGVLVPPHVFITLIAGGTKQKWWEGDRTLLGTLTFRLEDSMTICIDSTFYPPENFLAFVRYDAPNYVPRDSMPLRIWAGPPRIVVTSPNGGEIWLVGETHDITWFSDNFTGANVKLEFSTDEGANWMTIVESTPNDGSHPWVIPATPSDSCRVKVSDAEDGDPYDISDSNFSITYEPNFIIDAIPDTQWVKQGDSTSFEVILTALYGFSSPCTLTVEGLPSLATGEFDPAVIIPTDTSILAISTDTLTPLGVYPITITGTEMTKQIEHSIQKWLVVVSALNFKPTISVPESVLVYAGLTANFSVIATDPDTVDTLTITKTGVGEFPCPPRTSPNICYFWWPTEDADTLNSPYEVIFVVDDGRDSTDTGVVWITVFPYHIPPSGVPGDANGDGVADVLDIVFLINYLFMLGPAPNPPAAGDVNGDCFVGISDIIWLINYLYLEGPPPQIRCLPGDVNYDGSVNLLDVAYFIDYILFNGSPPVSMRSTDVNADCFINVVDLVYLINYLLRGGSPPQPGCVEPKAGAEVPPPPAIAEVGFSSLRHNQESRTMELPVYANFDVPVAGVALSITWNPEELSFLEPILTPRSEGLGLYCNLKRGELTIGVLDIYGKNIIEPGTGPIITLRFVPEDRKNFDLKSVRIEKATFVNTKARELITRMAK